MAEQLIKQVVKTPKISGSEKCAILLSEIGGSARESVLSYLKPEEISKIAKGMKKVGTKYDPSNELVVHREVSVLEELIQYGITRGIYTPIIRNSADNKKAKESKVSNIDADAMASVISAWLKS